MNRDKQIEEMARDLCDCMPYVVCDECVHTCEHCKNKEMAEYLYNAGYRKASEVTREIFSDLKAIWNEGRGFINYGKLVRLERIYTEGEK